MNNIVGIKCIAPILDASGYGEWSRNYIVALIKAGIPVTINPPSFEQVKPELGEMYTQLAPYINKPINYNVAIAWLTPDVAVQFLNAERQDIFKINFTLWETTALPQSWISLINKTVDECWLPGEWNAEVFRNSGVTVPLKIFKYPIDLQSTTWQGAIAPDINRPGKDDIYTFYFISQWTERKNFTDLLDAYWAEFQCHERVRLILKTHIKSGDSAEGQALQDHIKLLQGRGIYQKLPETQLVTQLLSREQIFALHQRCDCYVSPSRGEGLGLGILEAGLLGKPVITNLFGEQSSYLNAENAFIYNYSLRPVIGMLPNARYSSDQRWAQPDLDGMAKQMRFCYENRHAAQERGQRLRQHLIQACKPQQIAQTMLVELSNSIAHWQASKTISPPFLPQTIPGLIPGHGLSHTPPILPTQQLPAVPPQEPVRATTAQVETSTFAIAPPPVSSAPIHSPEKDRLPITPAQTGPTIAVKAEVIEPKLPIQVNLDELLTTALQQLQAGQLAEADRLCRQILQQQPDQPHALHWLGVIACQQDQPQEAIAYWQRCLALNPANAADVHSDLGFIFMEQGNPTEAARHLQQAIALNPNHFIAHTNLGSLLRSQGNLTEALQHLQRALTLNPTYAPTHTDLGAVFLQQGNLALAQAHLQHALSLDSDDPDTHYYLGEGYKKQGKLAEAAASYSRAIALNPDHSQAQLELAAISRQPL
jgi:Tfp pilus assembly protein PilF/glycosyltransferase involved in cell wall biosynthesis